MRINKRRTMRAGAVPWPEELAAAYVAAGFWRQRPLGAYLWDWAERFCSRVAVIDQENRVSYRDLAEHADVLAERLAGDGLRCGDNVLIQLPNCWELLAVLFACLRLGVAPVLALPTFREHELTQLALLADVTAIAVPDRWRDVDHQHLAERVARTCDRAPRILVLGDDVRAPNADLKRLLERDGRSESRRRWLDARAPNPGDVALFLLSGGTTGTPKIISRTHNDYEYNARRSGEVCGFHAETVYLAMLPAAHNFTLGSPGILGTLMVGGKVVLAPSPEWQRAFGLIDREEVTVTSAVPAVVRRWLQAVEETGQRPEKLRILQVGGSIFPPTLAEKVTPTLGCRLQQVFGMAEGLINYTRLDDPESVILTTQGRPISPADEIRIVADSGHAVEPGAAGELLTRGPYTPCGYFAAPDFNRQAFIDGWYRTGDVVRLDPSGNLIVEGRIKDLINCAGEKISVQELESLIQSIPQVVDIAVVPLPDEELGECVGAYVVVRPGTGLTLEEVRREFTRRGVAKFKIPRRVAVLPHLPTSPIGKVDKVALRQLAVSGTSTARTPGGKPE
jgi:2,3-dihydroxybenzoate-AMP ligase